MALRRAAARAFIGLGPIRAVVVGYVLYLSVGWLLLILPWMTDGTASALDHLFIAASAVSTTGLVTIDPGSTYSFLGELVVLALIQVGGLGYMTLGSFVLLSRRRRLGKQREATLSTVFSLPEDFEMPSFVRGVVAFTFAAEALGALCLWLAFRAAGTEDAVWMAIFHSISAFCTAGFSLFPNSLESYATNLAVVVPISVLSLLGGLGFIVLVDLARRVGGHRPATTFTTRVIVTSTLAILAAATVGLLLLDPGIASVDVERGWLLAGFQAISALTTVGFNTLPVGDLAAGPLFLVLMVMIVGASPAGTGGGMKVTTLTAALATVRSTLRQDDAVRWHGRSIPPDRLRLAFATMVIYLATIAIATLALLLLESAPFEDLVFEVASALGTVGLSRGGTGDLRPLGKLLMIAVMVVGRAGPLTVGLALTSPPRKGDDAGFQKDADLVV